MRFVRHPVCLALLPTVLLSSTVWAGSSGKEKDKAAVPTIRWAEGESGCTFTRGDDGKYRYGRKKFLGADPKAQRTEPVRRLARGPGRKLEK